MKAKLVTILSVGVLLAATFICGCSQDGESASGGESAAQSSESLPASYARAETSIPAGAARGIVVETMDSGGYTYVLVETGDETLWAAAPDFPVEIGSEATFLLSMPMRDYHSSTLDRTFELLYFAGKIEITGASGTAMADQATGGSGAMGGMPAGHPDIGVGATAPPASDIDLSGIQRAKNGMTVADLYAGKGALKNSQVVLRGKVVKFNSGIMGRNWLHIQDGSGGPGTNDITVTTNDVAAVGQTVLITGKLNADVDFGAGYSYDVIVEEASVVVE